MKFGFINDVASNDVLLFITFFSKKKKKSLSNAYQINQFTILKRCRLVSLMPINFILFIIWFLIFRFSDS